jgi:excisionase family DNA binding protein
MPRDLIPSDATIRAIRPGDKRSRLSDGDGLFLQLFVNGGSHGWRLDYSLRGRRRLMSLGTYPDTSLQLARRKANAARTLIAEGVDPLEQRKGERQERVAAHIEEERLRQGLPASGSFEAVAREWFEVKRSGWAPGYSSKIIARLENDVFPWLGKLAIAEIKAPQLLEMARRVEERGVIETAHRAMENCSQVFDYAIASGKLDRNPAANLKAALKPPVPKNFPAITDPARLADLLRAFDRYKATPVVRAALKVAPIVLLRPGELRFAEWCEINLDEALWTVPAARMKRELRGKLLGAPHLVPLPRQAVEAFRELQVVTGGGKMVFRGERHHERAMSENTINAALRAMGFEASEVTGHGFRATARTMLHERLGFDPDVIEAQLAHSLRDSLGRAYNRTEFIVQRREMLQAWADYLDQLRTQGAAAAAPAPAPSQPAGVATPPAIEPPRAEAPVATASTDRELSTLEAAKFLNVPHGVVVQEIDGGRLKSHQVGVDLRIHLSDVVAYAVQSRLNA